jgi:oligoendopeptidase F
MTKLRKDVSQKDCWNVEALYPSLKDWEKEFGNISKAKKAPFFPELKKYQGKLNKAKNIKACLDLFFSFERKLDKLYTYAHLRHDEDIANDAHKQAYDKVTALYHQFGEESSWLQPEILSLPKKELNSPVLKEYHFFLEKLFRLRKHTLDASQEKLLALASPVQDTSKKAFSALSDADFTFGTAKDSKGEEKPLTLYTK